jgi:uncharacterized membrane protein
VWLLAVLFILAGALHLGAPDRYLGIVPAYLPSPALLVLVSGVAEMLGGAGLLVTRYRRVAGIGLVALLVVVFPANIEMLRQGMEAHASMRMQALLWLRLPLQPLMIWWVWVAAWI